MRVSIMILTDGGEWEKAVSSFFWPTIFIRDTNKKRLAKRLKIVTKFIQILESGGLAL